MKTALEPATIAYTDRGSRFLGHLYPVSKVAGVERHLSDLKHRYPDATHHCYAYRLNPESLNEYAQDDGEPGGSAGPPILNAMKASDLLNALIVVVRYFGGTKLGRQGLIQAYRTTAEHCIDKADLGEMHKLHRLLLTYPYQEQNLINRIFHSFGVSIKEQCYRDVVECTIEIQTVKSAGLLAELEGHKHLGFLIRDLGRCYGVAKK